MASILKYTQRVFAAQGFVEKIDDGTSNPYLAIGRSSAWADENNPPTPQDNIDTDTDFWSNLIGCAKVDVANTTIVAKNNTWTSGTQYQVFDDSSTTAFVEPFYVLNSEGNVYECTVAPVGNSTIEPTGTSQNVLGDGYTWDYLYSLNATELQNLTTTSWLPVHDAYAAKLGANNVLIFRELEDPSTTGNKLPAVQYRQVAVLLNPQASGGGDFTGTYGSAADLEASLTPGIVAQIDNRKVISRSDLQTEEVIVIVTF